MSFNKNVFVADLGLLDDGDGEDGRRLGLGLRLAASRHVVEPGLLLVDRLARALQILRLQVLVIFMLQRRIVSLRLNFAEIREKLLTPLSAFSSIFCDI